MSIRRDRISMPADQRGAVLIVAMIFLVLLLIIGGSAIRTTLLEERMSGAMRDKNLSFQAAEAAIAEAESFLTVTPVLPTATPGYYPLTSPLPTITNDEPGRSSYWKTYVWATNGVQVTGPALTGVKAKAYYVIEALPEPVNTGTGGPTEAYRITAFAVGGTNNATTLLQTTYTR